MTEQNQRPREEVLADAIRVLTEAARLQRPVLQQMAPGDWQPDPGRTEQSGWAEFVSQALAGAAANIGGIDAVLAGRPGSWEADSIRNLLLATVGHDEAYLHEHRSEPLRVTVPVAQILAEQGMDELYDVLHASLDVREIEALGGLEDDAPYLWHYERTDTGKFVSSDPEASPWSIESWRADRQADGYPPERIAQIERTVFESPLTRGSYVAKSPQARAKMRRIDGQAALIQHGFRLRHETLDALRREDLTTSGTRSSRPYATELPVFIPACRYTLTPPKTQTRTSTRRYLSTGSAPQRHACWSTPGGPDRDRSRAAIGTANSRQDFGPPQGIPVASQPTTTRLVSFVNPHARICG